ncbi:hypothetical protein HDU96_007544 [Phlyctochytrium bullatum]|nr:hypothetical protein HDU96_007544 [Phlyctochytrium bullatum]
MTVGKPPLPGPFAPSAVAGVAAMGSGSPAASGGAITTDKSPHQLSPPHSRASSNPPVAVPPGPPKMGIPGSAGTHKRSLTAAAPSTSTQPPTTRPLKRTPPSSANPSTRPDTMEASPKPSATTLAPPTTPARRTSASGLSMLPVRSPPTAATAAKPASTSSPTSAAAGSQKTAPEKNATNHKDTAVPSFIPATAPPTTTASTSTAKPPRVATSSTVASKPPSRRGSATTPTTVPTKPKATSPGTATTPKPPTSKPAASPASRVRTATAPVRPTTTALATSRRESAGVATASQHGSVASVASKASSTASATRVGARKISSPATTPVVPAAKTVKKSASNASLAGSEATSEAASTASDVAAGVLQRRTGSATRLATTMTTTTAASRRGSAQAGVVGTATTTARRGSAVGTAKGAGAARRARAVTVAVVATGGETEEACVTSVGGGAQMAERSVGREAAAAAAGEEGSALAGKEGGGKAVGAAEGGTAQQNSTGLARGAGVGAALIDPAGAAPARTKGPLAAKAAKAPADSVSATTLAKPKSAASHTKPATSPSTTASAPTPRTASRPTLAKLKPSDSSPVTPHHHGLSTSTPSLRQSKPPKTGSASASASASSSSLASSSSSSRSTASLASASSGHSFHSARSTVSPAATGGRAKGEARTTVTSKADGKTTTAATTGLAQKMPDADAAEATADAATTSTAGLANAPSVGKPAAAAVSALSVVVVGPPRAAPVEPPPPAAAVPAEGTEAKRPPPPKTLAVSNTAADTKPVAGRRSPSPLPLQNQPGGPVRAAAAASTAVPVPPPRKVSLPRAVPVPVVPAASATSPVTPESPASSKSPASVSAVSRSASPTREAVLGGGRKSPGVHGSVASVAPASSAAATASSSTAPYRKPLAVGGRTEKTGSVAAQVLAAAAAEVQAKAAAEAGRRRSVSPVVPMARARRASVKPGEAASATERVGKKEAVLVVEKAGGGAASVTPPEPAVAAVTVAVEGVETKGEGEGVGVAAEEKELRTPNRTSSLLWQEDETTAATVRKLKEDIVGSKTVAEDSAAVDRGRGVVGEKPVESRKSSARTPSPLTGLAKGAGANRASGIPSPSSGAASPKSRLGVPGAATAAGAGSALSRQIAARASARSPSPQPPGLKVADGAAKPTSGTSQQQAPPPKSPQTASGIVSTSPSSIVAPTRRMNSVQALVAAFEGASATAPPGLGPAPPRTGRRMSKSFSATNVGGVLVNSAGVGPVVRGAKEAAAGSETMPLGAPQGRAARARAQSENVHRTWTSSPVLPPATAGEDEGRAGSATDLRRAPAKRVTSATAVAVAGSPTGGAEERSRMAPGLEKRVSARLSPSPSRSRDERRAPSVSPARSKSPLPAAAPVPASPSPKAKKEVADEAVKPSEVATTTPMPTPTLMPVPPAPVLAGTALAVASPGVMSPNAVSSPRVRKQQRSVSPAVGHAPAASPSDSGPVERVRREMATETASPINRRSSSLVPFAEVGVLASSLQAETPAGAVEEVQADQRPVTLTPEPTASVSELANTKRRSNSESSVRSTLLAPPLTIPIPQPVHAVASSSMDVRTSNMVLAPEVVVVPATLDRPAGVAVEEPPQVDASGSLTPKPGVMPGQQQSPSTPRRQRPLSMIELSSPPTAPTKSPYFHGTSPHGLSAQVSSPDIAMWAAQQVFSSSMPSPDLSLSLNGEPFGQQPLRSSSASDGPSVASLPAAIPSTAVPRRGGMQYARPETVAEPVFKPAWEVPSPATQAPPPPPPPPMAPSPSTGTLPGRSLSSVNPAALASSMSLAYGAPAQLTLTDRVLQEFLSTERTYVQELDVFLALYFLPMLSTSRQVIDENFLSRLFLNVEELEILGRDVVLPGIEVAVEGLRLLQSPEASEPVPEWEEVEESAATAMVFPGAGWWQRWWASRIPRLGLMMKEAGYDVAPAPPRTSPSGSSHVQPESAKAAPSADEDWKAFAEFRDIVRFGGESPGGLEPPKKSADNRSVSSEGLVAGGDGPSAATSLQDWWDQEAFSGWDRSPGGPKDVAAGQNVANGMRTMLAPVNGAGNGPESRHASLELSSARSSSVSIGQAQGAKFNGIGGVSGVSLLSRLMKPKHQRRRSLSLGPGVDGSTESRLSATSPTGSSNNSGSDLTVNTPQPQKRGRKSRRHGDDEDALVSPDMSSRRRSWSREQKPPLGLWKQVAGEGAASSVELANSEAARRALKASNRWSAASSISSMSSNVSSTKHQDSDAELDQSGNARRRSRPASARGVLAWMTGGSVGHSSKSLSDHSRSPSASSFGGAESNARGESQTIDPVMSPRRRPPTARPVTALAALFLWLIEVKAFDCYEYYVPRMAVSQKIASDLVTIATSGAGGVPLGRGGSTGPVPLTHGRAQSTSGSSSSHFHLAQSLLALKIGKRKDQSKYGSDSGGSTQAVGQGYGGDWTPTLAALEAGAMFLKAAKNDPRHGQLGILGYLVLPFQRLTRYAILFDRLLSTVPAEDEEAVELLTLLTQRLRKTVEVCNDAAKQTKVLSFTFNRRKQSLQDPPPPPSGGRPGAYGRPLPMIPTGDGPDPRRLILKSVSDLSSLSTAVGSAGAIRLSPEGVYGFQDTSVASSAQVSPVDGSVIGGHSSVVSSTTIAQRLSPTSEAPGAELRKHGALTLISDRSHNAALESADSWNSGKSPSPTAERTSPTLLLSKPMSEPPASSAGPRSLSRSSSYLDSDGPRAAMVALYSDGRLVLYCSMSEADATRLGVMPMNVIRVAAGSATLVAGFYDAEGNQLPAGNGGSTDDPTPWLRRRRIRIVGSREDFAGVGQMFEAAEGGEEGGKGFPNLFLGKKIAWRRMSRKDDKEARKDCREIVLEGEEVEVVQWWKAINQIMVE